MKKIYLSVVFLSVLLSFVSCEDEDTSLSLKGTWKGTTQGETVDQIWEFDNDTAIFTSGSSVAYGLYELDTDVSPNTLKVTYIYNKKANAGLEGQQWWGIVNYKDSKLTMAYRIPLGKKEFPASFEETTRIKVWDLTIKK